MTIQKPITIKFKLSGGKDSVIPSGVVETLTINIRDEVATFHFLDSKTTRRFSEDTVKKTGSKCQYFERTQSAIMAYPNMKQKEIVEKITKDIKELERKT